MWPEPFSPVALEEGAEPVVGLLLGPTTTTLVAMIGTDGLPDAVRRPVKVGTVVVLLEKLNGTVPGAMVLGTGGVVAAAPEPTELGAATELGIAELGTR